MPSIEVEVLIDASPQEVWDSVESIASHVEWMHDAAEIRFLTDQREGTGTTFECDTKVGPITLTDVMTITEWETAKVMGVTHEGSVTGVGKFTLEPHADITRFVWAEELFFPWFLGGAIGAVVAKPILTLIWKRNLSNLKKKVESEHPR